MQEEYINPFITGQAVRGADFFGRKNILFDISNFIDEDKNNVNYFIFGQRRSGKTSLLKTIQDKFKNENILLLYFNLQDKAEMQLENFLLQIRSRIIKYVNIEQDISEISNFEKFILKVNKIGNRKIVILFDEFDVMCKHTYRKKNEGKLETSFAPFLQSLSNFIIKNKISLKFILASGRNFNHKYKNLCSNLEAKAKSITLEGLDYNTVKEIVSLSKDIYFKEDAVNEINKISGGNPYIIQAMCHSLYDFAAKHNKINITDEIVRKQLNKIVKSFGNGLDSIWFDIPKEEKIILYLLANIIEEKNQYSMKDIMSKIDELKLNYDKNLLNENLTTLIQNKFILKQNSKSYIFKIEFFRKWIVEEITLKELCN